MISGTYYYMGHSLRFYWDFTQLTYQQRLSRRDHHGDASGEQLHRQKLKRSRDFMRASLRAIPGWGCCVIRK